MNRILICLLLFFAAGCSKPAATMNDDVDYWTCTMHPSVHSRDPGKCPICGMELVPVMKKGAVVAARAQPSSFVVPVERQQQIGVTYATVEIRELSRTVRVVGIVEADKQRQWSFVARTDGYVQQLFVASPGELVEKGAPLLSLYSPDLLTGQREFLMLRNQNRGGDLLAAARARLRQWNLSESQIAKLEKGGEPDEIVTLESPFRGVVTRVDSRQGGNAKVGDPLVEVADLSVVWVWADVYETELGFLKTGRKVPVTTAAFPGRVFEGTLRFIDPSVDPVRRTARARIDVENADFALKPGMYVDSDLALDAGRRLAVPVDAVMPTGLREIVFVSRGGNGGIEPRPVALDGKFGNFYAVRHGLVAGERVVNSANFLIDAESRVQGALRDFDGYEKPGAAPETAPQ
ncbi:MAG: efflux RND transporter periplasmic adaptor subunit [Terrimicrobiaceae bacterium]|nr:efflux RND transporter periplasmic adaptor subunit [Terrimicrobiaceae bacterium]